MSPRSLLLTCLPCLLAVGASAAHATDRAPRPRWYAADEVVALASERMPDGATVRAIVLDDDGRPALVVETMTTRGRVDSQVEIDGLFYDGRMLRVDHARALTRLGFENRGVVFDAELERRTLTCSVRLDRQGRAARSRAAATIVGTTATMGTTTRTPATRRRPSCSRRRCSRRSCRRRRARIGRRCPR